MHPPCIIVSAHSPDNTGRELRPKPLLLLPPLTLPLPVFIRGEHPVLELVVEAGGGHQQRRRGSWVV